jgi:hypothetical protein
VTEDLVGYLVQAERRQARIVAAKKGALARTAELA